MKAETFHRSLLWIALIAAFMTGFALGRLT